MGKMLHCLEYVIHGEVNNGKETGHLIVQNGQLNCVNC